MGTDCVGLGADCRVDGVEKWLDWLPSSEEPKYHKMFRKIRDEKAKKKPRREGFYSPTARQICTGFWVTPKMGGQNGIMILYWV